MQAANRLQRSLKAGRPAYGAWQMLPGTNLTLVMCQSVTNMDWLLVDLEHGNISDDSMHEIAAAAAACGVSPIVRVVEGRHWMIKRALDSGAHGILVPVLETVQDAKDVVRASKFPPLGTRGFEPLLAVEKFVEQYPHGRGVRELTGKEYWSLAWLRSTPELFQTPQHRESTDPELMCSFTNELVDSAVSSTLVWAARAASTALTTM